MPKELKLIVTASHNGHSAKPNGIVELSLKTRYSELPKVMQMMQFLNENIEVKAKVEGETKKFGTFNLNHTGIDHDGGSTIKLKSNVDNAELSELSSLAYMKEEMKFMFTATSLDGDVDEDDED